MDEREFVYNLLNKEERLGGFAGVCGFDTWPGHSKYFNSGSNGFTSLALVQLNGPVVLVYYQGNCDTTEYC